MEISLWKGMVICMKRIITRIMTMFIICLLLTSEISVPVQAADTNTASVDAQIKVWDIINTYADPEYFLEDVYHYKTGLTGKKEMTDAEFKELRQAAKKATKGCHTQYEKIRAVTEFVSNRIYYDYKYYSNKAGSTTFVKPYEVYKNKRAVCSGYTALTTTLFLSIGIPCMELSSYNHTYNAAYDSTDGRWVFLDTTWCSKNRYEGKGKWSKNKAVLTWFDKTPEELGRDMSHCVYWVDGLTDGKYNSAYYRLCTNKDSCFDYLSGWQDTKQWYLSLAGAKKNNVKAVEGFAGLKVRDVRCDTRKRGTLVNDKELKTLDLSETGITSIEGGAFQGYQALTKVTFPTSLQTIGTRAFAFCRKLKEIDLLGTRVSEIGYGSFTGCDAAKTILLPSTLKTIGNNAFVCGGTSKIKTKLITELPKKKLDLTDSNKGIWSGRTVTLDRNIYTIEFVANGAKSGKMSRLCCGIDRKTKLPANQFKRQGYKFTGWSTKKNGGGKIYKDKASIKNLAGKNKTIKLYAQWKKR